MKQCEKCGYQITEGAAFCTNCGAPVNAVMTEQSPTAPPNTANGFTSMTPPNTNLTASPAPTTPNVAPMNTTIATPQPTNPAVSSQALPNDETPKKKIDNKIVFMAVISVICLTVGIVGIVLALNGGGNSSNGSSNNGGNTAIGINNGGSSNEVNTIPNTGSSDTKVSYAGYEFSIPNNYDYEIITEDGTECLSVSDLPNSYIADICYSTKTFTSFESNIDTLIATIEETYGNPVTTGIETVNGREYHYFDIGEVDGKNCMIIISEADLHYFAIFVTSQAGISGIEYLDNIAKIVNTAQKKKSFADSAEEGGDLSPVRILPLETLQGNS